jgi:hypothetical protein
MAAGLLVRGFPHPVQWLSAMAAGPATPRLAAVMGSSSQLTTGTAEPGLPDLASADRYFTDGINLFRVADVTSGRLWKAALAEGQGSLSWR